MYFSDLSGEQARWLIDAEQALSAYQAARRNLDRNFSGSMGWKTVGGRAYLYRKRDGVWRSIGPRNAETEALIDRFRAGRSAARVRTALAAKRLDEMAPVNRAHRLGRMPRLTARILRALRAAGLLGRPVTLVGTNALFAYERMAGVHVGTAHLATEDVDLLFDSRAKLKLLSSETRTSGLAGILQRVDKSFKTKRKGNFRAINDDGYIVDLITPLPADPLTGSERFGIGSDDALRAVAIEGLARLVNAPKCTVVVMDERGYPLEVVVPDPRAFALHKAWLSERLDRDPLKRRRDGGQARLVATLVATRLPHLAFDDPVLDALPSSWRAKAAELVQVPDAEASHSGALEPDW